MAAKLKRMIFGRHKIIVSKQMALILSSSSNNVLLIAESTPRQLGNKTEPIYVINAMMLGGFSTVCDSHIPCSLCVVVRSISLEVAYLNNGGDTGDAGSQNHLSKVWFHHA